MNYAEFLIFFVSKAVDELKILNVSNYMLDNNTYDPLKEALKYFEKSPYYYKYKE